MAFEFAFRRVAIWFVVMVVALMSAYLGYMAAQGQSIADIGRSINVDTTTHRGTHKEPPACYKAPPHAAVHEKNKHCTE